MLDHIMLLYITLREGQAPPRAGHRPHDLPEDHGAPLQERLPRGHHRACPQEEGGRPKRSGGAACLTLLV